MISEHYHRSLKLITLSKLRKISLITRKIFLEIFPQVHNGALGDSSLIMEGRRPQAEHVNLTFG